MSGNEVWYEEFNSSFWLVISGSLFAFLGLGLRACLKSRCTNISVCYGLWACQRDPVADEFVGDIATPRLVSMEEGR
jgi:hypothetical protein